MALFASGKFASAILFASAWFASGMVFFCIYVYWPYIQVYTGADVYKLCYLDKTYTEVPKFSEVTHRQVPKLIHIYVSHAFITNEDHRHDRDRDRNTFHTWMHEDTNILM